MPETERRCDHCRDRKARRRYCDVCGSKARALYNRARRREQRAAGQKYWLAWWQKTYGVHALKRYRAYRARYMRRYRRRCRERAAA